MASHGRRPVIDDKKTITLYKYAYIFKRPSGTLQGAGGKERPDFSMFPHVDFFRFFSGVLGYI